jgi:hypothetical protein
MQVIAKLHILITLKIPKIQRFLHTFIKKKEIRRAWVDKFKHASLFAIYYAYLPSYQNIFLCAKKPSGIDKIVRKIIKLPLRITNSFAVNRVE